jgi:hypothetical protein
VQLIRYSLQRAIENGRAETGSLVNQFAEFIGRNGSFGKNTGVKQLFFTVPGEGLGVWYKS